MLQNLAVTVERHTTVVLFTVSRILMMCTAIFLEVFGLFLTVRNVINMRQMSVLRCVMVEEFYFEMNALNNFLS